MNKNLSKEEINKQIGLNIRYIRKTNKMSQEKFAEKLDLSPQFISDVERGIEGISVLTAIKICNVMQCSPLVIFANTYELKDTNNNIDRITQLSDKNKDIVENIIDALLNNQ